MGVISGDERYTEIAGRLLRGLVPVLARAALGFGNWLKIVELYLATPAEIVIIGDPGADDTRALLRTLHASYRPNLTIVGQAPGESAPFTSPLLERRGQIGGSATAYVCSNYQCDLPTSDPSVLADQLLAVSTIT